MTAQIDFLKRAVALNLQSLSLPEWLDEIESLRDQLAASQQREAELSAHVKRLRELLAWVDKYVKCAISGSIKEALAVMPEQSLAKFRN